jgi:tRNA (uracil-5-)-methyltransferase TRM9
MYRSNREVFDQIASSWYGFRHRTIFREELEMLVKRWQTGKLLNIGCGHGPDFVPFGKSFELYGVDFSIEMLRLAKKYAVKFKINPHLVLAEIDHLPFRSEIFNNVISVATYHHLKSEKERLAAFKELKRVLKPGGEAFITVWNHWQPKFWLNKRDVMVPWKTKEEVLYRYYHLFSYSELMKIVRRSGLRILMSFPESSYNFPVKYFSRNICLLIKSPSNENKFVDHL